MDVDYLFQFISVRDYYFFYKDAVSFESLKVRAINTTTQPSFSCLKTSFETFLLCRPQFPQLILAKIVEEYLPPHACMLKLGFGNSKFYRKAIVDLYLVRSYALHKAVSFHCDGSPSSFSIFDRNTPSMKISMIPTYPPFRKGWCQLDCLSGDFLCSDKVYEKLNLKYNTEVERVLRDETKKDDIKRIEYKGDIIEVDKHPFACYPKMKLTTMDCFDIVYDGEEIDMSKNWSYE